MKDYYVYAHYDGEEIVYVGCGVAGRAWVTNTSVIAHNRKEDHHNFMIKRLKAGDASFVKIIEENLTKEESRELEAFFLEEIGDTRFNVQYSTAHKERLSAIGKENSPLKKKVTTPNGEFTSLREAGRSHGVDHKTIDYRIKSENFEGYCYVSA